MIPSIPPRYTYVRVSAVDDYLHQAASSDWWPEGYTYDPEGDGSPIPSLGVHEHWNNATDRQYSRNLGSGEGIYLNYVYTSTTNVRGSKIEEIQIAAPNPFSHTCRFSKPEELSGSSSLEIYALNGKLVGSYSFAGQDQIIWDGTDAGSNPVPDGLYLYPSMIRRNGQGLVAK